MKFSWTAAADNNVGFFSLRRILEATGPEQNKNKKTTASLVDSRDPIGFALPIHLVDGTEDAG